MKSIASSTNAARVAVVVIAAAICVSWVFVIKIQPSSIGALVFLALWLALPYLAMAGLLHWFNKKQLSVLPWSICVCLVSVGGLALLVDLIYLRPDAQGAIGVVMTPALQGIAILLLAPLSWWMGRRGTR